MAFQTAKTFINLPVKDLSATIDFFTQLGFSFDQRFTDDHATCMILNEHTFAMLLVEPFFQGFTKKEIADTTKVAEVIVALSAKDRAEVDEIVNKALAAGATSTGEPVDHGFMYVRSFQDPNGHLWEFIYMDETAVPQA